MSTSSTWASDRIEAIKRPEASQVSVIVPGVELRPMAGGHNGARGLFTGLLSLAPGAIVSLLRAAGHRGAGRAGGRGGPRRRGSAIPPRAARRRRRDAAAAATAGEPLRRSARRAPRRAGVGRPPSRAGSTAGSSRSSSRPARRAGRGPSGSAATPSAPTFELAPHALFQDLYNAELGSRGICGGYGLFEPGAGSPAIATSSTSRSPSCREPPPASSKAGVTSCRAAPPPWSPRAVATTSSTSPSSPWP